jgi:hypothetical protein
LKWVVDDQVTALMKEAEKTAKDLIDDTQSILLQSNIYGSKFIKEVGKCSILILLKVWKSEAIIHPIEIHH